MIDTPFFVWQIFFKALFIMLFCHALADFGLQTEFVGKFKNRHFCHELPTRQRLNEVWPYCLFFHSLIHGGLVWMFTGSYIFGITETISHLTIDALKCEGKLNVHQDQALHILFKLIYACTIAMGIRMG